MFPGGIDKFCGLNFRIEKIGESVALINSEKREIARIPYVPGMDYSKTGIISALHSRLVHCGDVFSTLGSRTGLGGQKQETEAFVHHITAILFPLLGNSLLSTSKSADSQILLFVAVRHKTLCISVLYEQCVGVMSAVLVDRPRDIFVPLCKVGVESEDTDLSPECTRSKIRGVFNLMKALERISQGLLLASVFSILCNFLSLYNGGPYQL